VLDFKSSTSKQGNMGRRKTYFDPEHLYFVTTTVVNHKPIFRRPQLVQIIIDSLDYIRKSHWVKIYAYVIMPDHLHLILKYLDNHTPAQVMRDFKKFTAKRIIERLQEDNDQNLLTFFVHSASHTSKQRYKVWQEQYFAKNIFSEEFLVQKMAYVHNNPLQENWRLAERAEDYPYSSARNYLLGDQSVLEIDLVTELVQNIESRRITNPAEAREWYGPR